MSGFLEIFEVVALCVFVKFFFFLWCYSVLGGNETVSGNFVH